MSKNLPLGWAEENLGNLVLKLVDGSHNPPSGKSSGQKMLSARNILDGRIDATECRLLDEESFVQEDKRTQVDAGDVLLTIVGTIGRSAVVPEDFERITLQRSVAVIKPIEVSSSFVSYQLRGSGCEQYFDQAARGTAQKGVYLGALAQLPLRIPPIAEQHRIVDKIDELFSSIDDGERLLKRVQTLIERFQQSVLKAAVTGALTRDWREQQAGEHESGEALLTRILEARREAWETAELAKMTANHKRPLNDLWKKKYRAPVTSDTSDLPELPHGWCWATADQFCSLVTDGEHLTPPRTESGVYLLSARNVRNGEIILHDVDYISEETHTALSQRLCINAGDVLLSCSGSVGRSCVVPTDLTFSLVRSVAVLKTVFVRSQYVSLALRSQLLQDQIRSKSTQTAQANIFQGSIRSLVFPVPPLHEQDQIISVCMAQIDSAHRTENEIGLLSTGSSRLRSSTLNLAFRGGLVAQDAEDEPASVLLERIAAQRTASIKRPATKQVRKRKAKA